MAANLRRSFQPEKEAIGGFVDRVAFDMAKKKQPKFLERWQIERIEQVAMDAIGKWQWLTFGYYMDDYNHLRMIMPVSFGVLPNGVRAVLGFEPNDPSRDRPLNRYMLYDTSGMDSVATMPMPFDASKLPDVPGGDPFKETLMRIGPRVQ